MRVLIQVMIATLVFITSCNQIQVYQLMNDGYVDDIQQQETIAFEDYFGVIIIDVAINDEVGRFLFDSGAPVVLNPPFAEKVGVTPLVSQQASDSQTNSQEISFGRIDDLKIAEIQFHEIGTAITNLNTSEDLKCLNLDGVIGANLMKTGAWRIDFQNKVMTFGRSGKLLVKESPSYSQLSFSTNFYSSPIVNLNVEGYIVNDVTIDLGSNEGLGLEKRNDLLRHLSQADIPKERYGYGAVGIFGTGNADTTYLVTSSLMNPEVENIPLPVSFFNTNTKTLGTAFLSNLDLIIDWKEETIFFKSMKKEIPSYTYGFSLMAEGQKLLVKNTLRGSKAYQFGIRPGDQIMNLQGVNTTSIDSQYCEIQRKFRKWQLSDDSISVSIQKRNQIEVYSIKRFERY